MLRSHAKRGVSKHEPHGRCPPFETHLRVLPLGEVIAYRLPVSEARWLISMWLPSGSTTKA